MSNKIHVMQMIDSLSIGGAERVSVNYANALSEENGYMSFHCATREEGMLKSFLLPEVNYFFMNKKSLFDRKSYFKLVKYIKNNKIDIIHAHSSSFFTAVIVKLFTGVKIVWHDHYGKAESIEDRPLLPLQIGSLFFSQIISVNNILKSWAQEKLFLNKDKILYLPNYADLKFDTTVPNLPGEKGKRIVLLANLRPQKDHLTMLKAFSKVIESGYKDWVLLLVGRDWNDTYSDSIKEQLNENTFILGGRSDTAQILKACDIGVLSSVSEGLPVALLEYALASLAVVVTAVGECDTVVNKGDAGLVVPAGDDKKLSDSLIRLISDIAFRKDIAKRFSQYVDENYSKESAMKEIRKVYSRI